MLVVLIWVVLVAVFALDPSWPRIAEPPFEARAGLGPATRPSVIPLRLLPQRA
jgi:hypothetical protein